ELFELDVQGVELDLIAQGGAKREPRLAADKAAEKVGLQVVQRQNIRRFGGDIDTSLQVRERLAEDAGSFEYSVPADALELPAVVMTAAPNDAIDIVDFHAGLENLLAQGDPAVPPYFHRLARHGGGVQNQFCLDIDRFADLQRL